MFPGVTAADSSPQVAVVVPAYNEGPRLGGVLTELQQLGHQTIVVDDGSRDETLRVAAAVSGVAVLSHPINLGQGAALQTGFDFAIRSGADVMISFDADGQHRVADIAAVASPVCKGEVDVALGSRFLGTAVDIPPQRVALLKAGVLFTRVVSGLKLTDTHNGLRAFSRDALQKVRITQPRMAHASELLDEIARHRLRYVEVPVEVIYRHDLLEKGQSGWNAVRITSEFLMGRLTGRT